MVVDVDGGGDVHGRDEAQASLTPLARRSSPLRGDMHHFAALFGFKDQVFGVTLHKRILDACVADGSLAAWQAGATTLYPKMRD